jgi:hypothetical protein
MHRDCSKGILDMVMVRSGANQASGLPSKAFQPTRPHGGMPAMKGSHGLRDLKGQVDRHAAPYPEADAPGGFVPTATLVGTWPA